MVHPCTVVEAFSMTEPIHQESSAIERLPEENVSIVETLEGKEDRPESVRPIVSATIRKKLYFNPAYFELELLMVMLYKLNAQPNNPLLINNYTFI